MDKDFPYLEAHAKRQKAMFDLLVNGSGNRFHLLGNAMYTCTYRYIHHTVPWLSYFFGTVIYIVFYNMLHSSKVRSQSALGIRVSEEASLVRCTAARGAGFRSTFKLGVGFFVVRVP